MPAFTKLAGTASDLYKTTLSTKAVEQVLIAKFVGFLFAGGIGFIIDTGVYAALILVIGVPWSYGRLFALLAAIGTTYLLNHRYTFRAVGNPYNLASYLSYVAASLFGASVNFAVFSAIALLLPSPAQIFAFICGVAAGLAINFILYDRVVFAQSAH